MLKEEHRTQLNSVIGRMKDAGESEDSIRGAVGQFKTKYDKPEQPEEKGFFSEFVSDPLSQIGSDIKSGLSSAGDKFTDDTQSLPSRVLQGFGKVAQTAIDVPTKIVERGLQESGVLQGFESVNKAALNVLPDVVKKGAVNVGGKVGKKIGEVAKEYPETAGNIDAGLDIAGVVPGLGGIARGVGKGVKGAGKTVLKGQLKIPKKLAQEVAGKGKIALGKKKIMDDIAKFDIESSKGFSGMVDNVEKAITKQNKIADKSLIKAAKDLPDARIDVANPFIKLTDDIKANKVGIPIDKKEKALKTVDDMFDVITKEFNDVGNLTLAKTREAKQLLSEKVFSKGQMNISDDPIIDHIKEKLANNFADEVGKIVPKHQAANRNLKDLFNVRKAVDEAFGRVSNRDFLGFTGKAIAGGGLTGAAYSQSPALLAATAGLVGAGKLAGSGRVGSSILKAGRTLGKFPSVPLRTTPIARGIQQLGINKDNDK